MAVPLPCWPGDPSAVRPDDNDQTWRALITRLDGDVARFTATTERLLAGLTPSLAARA